MRQLRSIAVLVLASAFWPKTAMSAPDQSFDNQFGLVRAQMLAHPLPSRMTREGGLLHRTTHETSPDDPLLLRQKPYLDLIDKVKYSVVVLRTEEPGQANVPEGKRKTSLCTGVFIDSSAILDRKVVIATNSHCVESRKPGDETQVGLYDDSQNYPKWTKGRILAFGNSDGGKDLAFVELVDSKLNRAGLPLWEKLRVGEEVVAIGHPRGLIYSASAGRVSAIGRDRLESQSVLDLTQSDVAVNPGNSGGPLFNLWGDVVALNNAIISRSGGFEGISLAVPAKYVAEGMRQFKRTGNLELGYLQMAFGADKEGRRIVVQSVAADGPAAAAQLKENDVIVRIDGVDLEAFTYEEASRTFLTVTKYKSPGETVSLAVRREGKELQVAATLGGPPKPKPPERPEIIFPEPPAAQPRPQPQRRPTRTDATIAI